MKLISTLLLAAVSALSLSGKGSSDPTATSPVQSELERGEYIVHHVAMCVQCHSPRDKSGKLRSDRLLMGGQVPFKTPWKDRWAELAPNLKQLLGYTDEEAMQLLTEGLKRNGQAPRGPMPPFRLNEADAKAVIAYLRSL